MLHHKAKLVTLFTWLMAISTPLFYKDPTVSRFNEDDPVFVATRPEANLSGGEMTRLPGSVQQTSVSVNCSLTCGNI